MISLISTLIVSGAQVVLAAVAISAAMGNSARAIQKYMNDHSPKEKEE